MDRFEKTIEKERNVEFVFRIRTQGGKKDIFTKEFSRITVRGPVFLGPRRRPFSVHSAVPTDYVIVPLGRRMHYEITADKSVLHWRGQPTAFMNENLYCSLANRSRARLLRLVVLAKGVPPLIICLSSIFPQQYRSILDSINLVFRADTLSSFIYLFIFFFSSVSRDRQQRQGTSRNLESFLNPFNSSLSFTE